ncbi:ATP-binding protein [Pseudofrankia sp. DC12]|uniref:ATP-binding protein n=1 Tax=Pseudofrankia sp. DC12 TaxID=683315 RepID=UPI000A41562C|nr:ATP-binding protein [Pseudofrankia sp. DC12]
MTDSGDRLRRIDRTPGGPRGPVALLAQRPAPAERVAAARFPLTDEAVPAVRKGTVETLTAWSVDADAVAVAETVACELVANGVQASKPGDEYGAVRLTASNGTVVIEVWNRDHGSVPRLTPPDVDSETGRGLQLVDALCSQWHSYRAASGGIVVRAEL